MVTAMLFAGGIGARMKYSDMPKQFLEVGGKPIIIHTMEHFARHPKVDAIVVACKADWIGYLNELIEAFNVAKVKAVVPGGANGFDSIHNGVMATAEFSKDPEDIILICDGVRPMLSEELITNCIKDTKKYKTAVPVTPSIDSLLYSEDGETLRQELPEKYNVHYTGSAGIYNGKNSLGSRRSLQERYYKPCFLK